MITFLHVFCSVAAWIGFCYMLNSYRRNRDDPALRYLCVTFGLSGISFTLLVPAVWIRLDSLIGVPNITALLASSGVICLVFGQQITLQYWNHPPAIARRKARTRIVLCGLTLAATTILFVNLEPLVRHPEDFSVYEGHSAYYFTYLLIYIGVYTSGEVIIARTSWKSAKETGNPHLRAGLQFLAVGACLTLGYSAIRLGNLFGSLFGVDLPHRNELSWLFGNTGAFLTIVGFTFPGWAPRLQPAYDWCVRFLAYHRLHSLWATMHQAIPEIALSPPGRRIYDFATVRELEYRLYRRVIEIRDGQLALLPYADCTSVVRAEAFARKSGLSEGAIRSVTAAVAISTALNRLPGGQPSCSDMRLPRATGSADSDLDSEVTELLAIWCELRSMIASNSWYWRSDEMRREVQGGGDPERVCAAHGSGAAA
ncbi:MAB_1171c family putative transporter [Streptomyces caelestis]|uniref:DUF6545 domain-containing protein n=1 Tax=Streptomyces caelestis TaxID=36816 RepID=A0A7W9HBN2_9ACTN|nr:MAB_1171c family putative transporter [Streptomyces caelestis]MBB5799233.1 hypothetical protein [Streptomyces caelestis]GGW46361.1 hypothetical protein GCM10010320_28250 [Streptomyces caelestis]